MLKCSAVSCFKKTPTTSILQFSSFIWLEAILFIRENIYFFDLGFRLNQKDRSDSGLSKCSFLTHLQRDTQKHTTDNTHTYTCLILAPRMSSTYTLYWVYLLLQLEYSCNTNKNNRPIYTHKEGAMQPYFFGGTNTTTTTKPTSDTE